MITIGLTGGIASGKNFVANILRKRQIPVFDADLEVHKLFVSNKDLIAKIAKIFPSSLSKKGQIDRNILRQLALENQQNIKILENLIHPQIRIAEVKFLKTANYQKKAIVAFNTPLLIEGEFTKPALLRNRKPRSLMSKNEVTKYKKSCSKACTNSYRKFDYIISAVIPKNTQLQRFLKRDPAKGLDFFNNIVEKQTTNLQRRKYSDFLINNGSSKASTFQQTKSILLKIRRTSRPKEIFTKGFSVLRL